MAKKLHSCSDVARRLQSYLDRELPEPSMAQIAAHLDACIECGYEADAFRKLKEEISSIAPPIDSSVIHRLREFSARIADEAAQ